jgi:hypothetical protein
MLWSLAHCWFLIKGREVLQGVCMTSSSMSQRHILFAFSNSLENCLF